MVVGFACRFYVYQALLLHLCNKHFINNLFADVLRSPSAKQCGLLSENIVDIHWSSHQIGWKLAEDPSCSSKMLSIRCNSQYLSFRLKSLIFKF